jgi:hypothetical protein
MRQTALTAVLLLLGLTQSALACSLSNPLIDINWRVAYANDGSFRNGGENDEVTGQSVFDLQGGRFGQVIGVSGPCEYKENLLLADCNAVKITVVDYLPGIPSDEPVILQGAFTVDDLLLPNGLLAQVSDKAIPEMRRYLIQNGAGDANGLLNVNAEEKPRDQFNPFQGCKVLYPESPGATYEWPKAAELTE